MNQQGAGVPSAQIHPLLMIRFWKSAKNLLEDALAWLARSASKQNASCVISLQWCIASMQSPGRGYLLQLCKPAWYIRRQRKLYLWWSQRHMFS